MARYLVAVIVKENGEFSKKTRVFEAPSRPSVDAMIYDTFKVKVYLGKGQIAEGIKYVRCLNIDESIKNDY